jgi:hypothetical protein
MAQHQREVHLLAGRRLQVDRRIGDRVGRHCAGRAIGPGSKQGQVAGDDGGPDQADEDGQGDDQPVQHSPLAP